MNLNSDGDIKVYGKQQHTQYLLLASLLDTKPYQVKYISFASWESSPIVLLYNCSNSTPPFDGITSIQTSKVHPLLTDPSLPMNFDKRNCKYVFSFYIEIFNGSIY